MAFRKRNVILSRGSDESNPQSDTKTSIVRSIEQSSSVPAGTRLSPIDGRLTTSTGTSSLDSLLAGHAGLVLGSVILLEENGTTDYASTLLRHFAAEGIVQDHKVHVVGVGDSWGRELPGLVGPAGADKEPRRNENATREKMKIAWRYEGLGDFGERETVRSKAALDRKPASKSANEELMANSKAFCHVYDLAKRLEFPKGASIQCINIPRVSYKVSPFSAILETFEKQLSQSPPHLIHRLIIPSLLSPAIYPPHASQPHHVLAFWRGLRSLLRQHSGKAVAMISLPLSLYPRTSGLVRWMEVLADGVIEFTPFPHLRGPGEANKLATSGASTAQEEHPQGMVKIHKLPVFHERGGGGAVASMGDDLAFTVSRRKFVIRPFNLPPADGDTEAQQGRTEDQKASMEF